MQGLSRSVGGALRRGSPRAGRAIELADEAASRLGPGGIGTEHLLLGLLKVKKGIAAQALTHLGLEPDGVRDMVLEALAALCRQNPPPGAGGGWRSAPLIRRVLSAVGGLFLVLGKRLGIKLGIKPGINRKEDWGPS
jgi:hypothetical protein